MRRLKTLSSLSTLRASSVLLGSLVLTACGGEGEGHGAEHGAEHGVKSSSSSTQNGEGEGSVEGEGVSSNDPATDDVDYLHRLGQVRGHLFAFISLHRAGLHEMSATHAKHPESELYEGLVPAFKARQKQGFASELEFLETAMATKGDVETAYEQTILAIIANEPDVSLATRLLALAALTRTAADEFKLGVNDTGDVINAHEYQDAFGFLNAGRNMLSGQTGGPVETQAVIAIVNEQLNIARSQFTTLDAAQVDGKASVIYGAAARIEIAALGLQ